MISSLAVSARLLFAACIFWCLPLRSHVVAADQRPLGDSRHGGLDSQPNIVFILSDDQDLHMDSLSYMPQLQNHLIEQGTYFRRHYCTVALCCPSRATLWTGKEAHNTNVTDVNPPYGGYPKFVSQGFNDAYLPIWLQEAGYNTYYTGKLFNAQSVVNYNKPFAKGWTGSDFLLDPYTYEYLNATFQRNRDPPVSYEGQYSTDVLLRKASGFLEDALADKKPFFLTIAPTAPHSNVNIRDNIIDGNFSEHSVTQSPPIPADRHKHLFSDVVVPRTPHFNPSKPHSVSWISRLPQQNQTVIESNDHWYRSRLQVLQPIDEFIPSLISRLESAGVLNNTYIVYSTDNGYHIGQHRLQPGKQCPIEEDLNIPFIIRGPGIPKNAKTEVVTSHTDLAPTFLQLAGVKPGDEWKLDGSAIPLTYEALNNAQDTRQEHVNVESWGIIMSEGKYDAVLYPNHTYKALRLIGKDYNLVYTVWCSGEHELYDLNADPYQQSNIHPETNTSAHPSTLLHFTPTTDPHRASSHASALQPQPHPQSDSSPHSPVPLTRLLPRLDALLAVLKTCIGAACTSPWSVLHPPHNGLESGEEPQGSGKREPQQVRTLHDALAPRFDAYYEGLERVVFWKCEKGYIRESEGPDWGDGSGTGAMALEVDTGALWRGKEEEQGEEHEGEGREGRRKRTEL